MSKVQFRDVSPLVQILRNILLGRKHTKALRFSPEMSTRSPPPPVLPDGPSHKLFNNYYSNRDARREVAPPLVISGQLQIDEGSKQMQSPKRKFSTPGNVHAWD